MSMLDIAQRVSNAQEPEIVPSGEEYNLEVVKFKTGTSDKHNLDYVAFSLRILNAPEEIKNPRLVDVFMWTSSPDEVAEAFDPGMANDNDLRMKDFFEGINFDITRPFEIEEVIGSSGWAILGDKDEGEHGMKNVVKRWIKSK